VAQEEASGRLEKYANKFLKVAAVIGVVKTAYGQMQEKANEVLDQQIERMQQLGDKGRELFDKRKGLVDWKLDARHARRPGRGDEAGGGRRPERPTRQGEAAQRGPQVPSRTSTKGNKMVSFTKGVRLIEKTDNPFGGLEFTKAEKKRREAVLQEAEKDFAQAQKGMEGYKKSLRELGDPNENKELVAGHRRGDEGPQGATHDARHGPGVRRGGEEGPRRGDRRPVGRAAGPRPDRRLGPDPEGHDRDEPSSGTFNSRRSTRRANRRKPTASRWTRSRTWGPGRPAEVEKKFAGLRDQATATATARLKKEGELAKRDIDDELEDKRRLAAYAFAGASSKVAFGAISGPGRSTTAAAARGRGSGSR
jgi:hypothetical protein